MKHHVLEVGLFITLQVIICSGLFAFYEPDANSYLASSLDKYERAVSTPGPRILMLGGSSVAWGTHSPIVEEATGRSTINLAYHGGTGLNFRIREVEGFGQPGDLVVLSIEYIDLDDQVDGLLLWRIFASNSSTISLLSWKGVKRVLDDGALYGLRDFIRRTLYGRWQVDRGPYSRDTFNEHGDAVAHYELETPGFGESHVQWSFSESKIESAIERLNKLYERCRGRDIDVVYFFPIIPSSEYVRIADDLEHLHHAFVSGLHIPMLNTPSEAVYPDEDFFDTVYHLTREAGMRRTSLLVERIRPHIK
jgi:hypothetical protein